jgi:hypothetical protein
LFVSEGEKSSDRVSKWILPKPAFFGCFDHES